MNTARDPTWWDRYRDDKILYGDIIWFYILRHRRVNVRSHRVPFSLRSPAHDNREYKIYVVVLWSLPTPSSNSPSVVSSASHYIVLSSLVDLHNLDSFFSVESARRSSKAGTKQFRNGSRRRRIGNVYKLTYGLVSLLCISIHSEKQIDE